MSYFLGTTSGPMNSVFGSASAMQDASWSRYAGRTDFCMNPWADYGNLSWSQWPWPPSSMLSGDLSSGYAQIGQDAAVSETWSPWVEGSFGDGARKYIIGQAKDSNGTGISGATITAYLTSTDEVTASVGSDSSGNFAVSTPYSGLQHYLRATGTGVAGSTVNTLTPTNADGT